MVFLVLLPLFSQLALAQYVCPQQLDIEVMAAMMESGQPCDGMDQDQAVLCHQHSADPAKTFQAVKLAVVSQPLVTPVHQLRMVVEAQVASAIPPPLTSEAQPPPAPLFLSTLRIRV